MSEDEKVVASFEASGDLPWWRSSQSAQAETDYHGCKKHDEQDSYFRADRGRSIVFINTMAERLGPLASVGIIVVLQDFYRRSRYLLLYMASSKSSSSSESSGSFVDTPSSPLMETSPLSSLTRFKPLSGVGLPATGVFASLGASDSS